MLAARRTQRHGCGAPFQGCGTGRTIKRFYGFEQWGQRRRFLLWQVGGADYSGSASERGLFNRFFFGMREIVPESVFADRSGFAELGYRRYPRLTHYSIYSNIPD